MALSSSRTFRNASPRTENLLSEGIFFIFTPPINPALSTDECAWNISKTLLCYLSINDRLKNMTITVMTKYSWFPIRLLPTHIYYKHIHK